MNVDTLLRIPIRTPEGGSWGYPYIKIFEFCGYIYIYKQIQVIHRWIQNSALQLRSGLTVVVYLLLCIYIYIFFFAIMYFKSDFL